MQREAGINEASKTAGSDSSRTVTKRGTYVYIKIVICMMRIYEIILVITYDPIMDMQEATFELSNTKQVKVKITLA